MKYTSIKKIGLTTLAVLLTGGALFAQNLKVAPGTHWTGPVVPYSVDWPGTPIFTNLSVFAQTGVPTLWDCADGGYYVLGPSNCLLFSEQWIAVSFWTGSRGATATRLQAAITRETTCGSAFTAKVLLGIYTDNGLEAEAPDVMVVEKTANVPVFACGALAQATIAATTLAPNTHYWLTARTAPGTANANLTAVWNASNNAEIGYQLSATPPWAGFSGLTPAGAVLGTVP